MNAGGARLVTMDRSFARAALVGLAAAAVWAAPAAAQRREPDTVFSVEADWIGGAVSYARTRGPGRYWGLEAGVGGGFVNRMLVSGRHFSEEDGPSYQPRDGAVGKELIEILHVATFRRWSPTERLSWDMGARASVFIHTDSSDDDPALPLFLGAYANVLWGNRWLKVGPRLLAGVFSEGSRSREFGVYLVPLAGRVSFGW